MVFVTAFPSFLMSLVLLIWASLGYSTLSPSIYFSLLLTLHSAGSLNLAVLWDVPGMQGRQ